MFVIYAELHVFCLRQLYQQQQKWENINSAMAVTDTIVQCRSQINKKDKFTFSCRFAANLSCVAQFQFMQIAILSTNHVSERIKFRNVSN